MNVEVEYAIGRVMKVRRLAGKFRVIDSWLVGGHNHRRRRYKLSAVEGTGAMLNVTESFADDMEPVADSQPTELTLVPDPDAAPLTVPAPNPSRVLGAGPHPAGCDCYSCVDTGLYRSSQELSGDVPGYSAAMLAPEAAADAIRSPADAADTYGRPGEIEGADFGGELDEYSVGANRLEEPGELKDQFKSVRRFPQLPTYSELRGIVYNARFKGLENLSSNELAQLDDGTPMAVAVTHETNGHGIWIITTEADNYGGEVRRANLEMFYPNATGSSADALEYAVLLALRQVPIRTGDLETMLLSLALS